MPVPLPNKRQPDALELFTDRVEEQKILRHVLQPVVGDMQGRQYLLTVFYGVGGVGKSALCRRACEIAASELKDDVRVAVTSFDDDRWREGTAFTEVCAELCRCLVERKILPQLTVGLLMLHGQQAGRSGETAGGLDAGWSKALAALDRGVNAANIPGLSLVVDGLKWWREHAHRQTLRERLQAFGLWPEEQYDKLNIPDLEKKLSQALYFDLVDWLKDNPRLHLRLILDGFERLQSRERREDSQKRIQEFIGFFAGGLEPEACARFRALLFGREKLRWDEIYQDPGWNEYWTQHLLGGLAEDDARDFLRKTQAWLRSHGQAPLADGLLRNEAKILDASDENLRGQRVFYPFYLNLAVELVERARQGGTDPDLGHAPAELQDRFFRYLDKRELRALKILALSEVFDESLYDWLARERLIDFPVHSFHTELRQEHSYFQKVEGREGDWRFHRLFEDALHARWQSTEAERTEGRQVVDRLLDYYGAASMQKTERDWTETDVEQWRRGMEIIVTQGPELGLLPTGQWMMMLDTKPWVVDHYWCTKYRIDFTRRIIKEKESRLGPFHQDTLFTMSNLAWLFRDKGDYDAAEVLTRQVLEGREQTLGPEHPETLWCVGDLGHLLSSCKNDYESAEPLYSRVLAAHEKALGPEHPNTLESMRDLADLLTHKADYVKAEALYRRLLEGWEKILGAAHPTTRKCARSLGFLLRLKGDKKAAESFVRWGEGGGGEVAEARHELEESEKALGPYHPQTLMRLRILGLRLHSRGDYEESEALARRALAGNEKALGPEHPETLDSAQSLADLLYNKGDMEGAEALFRRAVAGLEQALGLEHSDTLRSLDSLASLLEGKVDYSGAEVLRRRALAGSEKAFGLEHPDTLARVTNLAVVLSDKGDHEGAEALFRRALAGSQKVLGPKHPATCHIFSQLGSLFMAKGDYENAEALFRKTLHDLEKSLGPEHLDTVWCVGFLGNALFQKGGYEEAEALYRRALAGFTITLGAEDPVTLITVDKLADVLRLKSNDESAELLLRRLLGSSDKVLGPEHADTLGRVEKLARLLADKGDYIGAEALYLRALAGRQKSAGLEHPDTLFVLAGIARILCLNKHDYEKAEVFYHQVLAGYEKAFGKEDSNTLTSVRNLAFVLKEKGDIQKSLALLRQHASLSSKAHEALRYILACYECLSGNIDHAMRLVSAEITAKPASRQQALKDDDLKTIHDFIRGIPPIQDSDSITK